MGMLITVRSDGKRVAEPCDCSYEKRIFSLIERARVPEMYRDVSLGDFHLADADVSVQQAHIIAKRFTDDYPFSFSPRGRGLLFWGPAGTGKTRLAASVLNDLIREKSVHGLFCVYDELLTTIRSSYSTATYFTELDVLKPVIQAEVLVLDDLGSTRATDWVWDTVAYIINSRYNRNLVTIVTTNFRNLPPPDLSVAETMRHDSLGDRIGERMASRLAEMCRDVPMNGQNRRRAS
jgi:DNA replication protein DnaC